jgi:glycosyltransferase involved in cell wall biosynthesis
VIVHQLLSGAGPVDAVTGQAREYRRLFGRWGWGGEDRAAYLAPGLDGAVRPLAGFHPAPGDVLLLHYSAYAPKLQALLELPNPKLLVSHNVTPARYLWDHEAAVAIHCAVGRAQLPEFARRVDLAAGVSEYNAAELRAAGARRTAVIPILFDPRRLGDPAPDEPPPPPTILCVGRLTPHKRHDEVLRAFALYRRHRARGARLVLVGEPLNPRYERALRELAEQLAPGAVTFERGLGDAELADRYRAAHALLSLSEHEGFCIPVLEAFQMGVPVVARPVGGIPEVAGDAALLTEADGANESSGGGDLAVVAELLQLAVSDAELRGALRERAAKRLEAYSYERTAQRLREALTGLRSR